MVVTIQFYSQIKYKNVKLRKTPQILLKTNKRLDKEIPTLRNTLQEAFERKRQ